MSFETARSALGILCLLVALNVPTYHVDHVSYVSANTEVLHLHQHKSLLENWHIYADRQFATASRIAFIISMAPSPPLPTSGQYLYQWTHPAHQPCHVCCIPSYHHSRSHWAFIPLSFQNYLSSTCCACLVIMAFFMVLVNTPVQTATTPTKHPCPSKYIYSVFHIPPSSD